MLNIMSILAETTESAWYDKPEIWIPIVVSILSLFGVGTLTSLFWKDQFEKKKEKRLANTEEAKQAAKDERLAEMREVTTECWNKVDERLQIIEKEIKIQKDQIEINNEGTQAGLRNSLLNAYYCTARKGYRTRYDTENFRAMYEAYTKLGGNSFIQHDVAKWFDEIPSKESFEKEKGEN